MGRANCYGVPGAAPLIHEVHGEAYKVTKAVYMALPWLWQKLGAIFGTVASTIVVKGTVGIATEEGQIQLIPFPVGVNAKQVRDYTCWVATLDGKRKYKYANSYLTEQGLVLRLDHQAPDTQKGMPFAWSITLANAPIHMADPTPPPPPHGFPGNVPPFNFPGIPGMFPPPAPGTMPPSYVENVMKVPPRPMPPAPWINPNMPCPAGDDTVPCAMPPIVLSTEDGENPVPIPPQPPVPPAWMGLV